MQRNMNGSTSFRWDSM